MPLGMVYNVQNVFGSLVVVQCENTPAPKVLDCAKTIHPSVQCSPTYYGYPHIYDVYSHICNACYHYLSYIYIYIYIYIWYINVIVARHQAPGHLRSQVLGLRLGRCTGHHRQDPNDCGQDLSPNLPRWCGARVTRPDSTTFQVFDAFWGLEWRF